jgi:hypothetical protein
MKICPFMSGLLVSKFAQGDQRDLVKIDCLREDCMLYIADEFYKEENGTILKINNAKCGMINHV